MWGIAETLGTLVMLAVAALVPGVDDRWACDALSRTGFTTDPIVHPVGVSLSEIAAQMPGTDSFVIEQRGWRATVTYRDDGLIVGRYEYSRGAHTGWQLERGHECSG